MNLDRLCEAREIFEKGFVMPDIKEGEISVSDIWFKLHTRIIQKDNPHASDDEIRALLNDKYPLPDEYDFRMSETK